MNNSTNQSENTDEKISIKEIHETLWRCRDFELSHLWQRSIFLSAFLILCFTGYGGLLMLMFEKSNLFEYVNLLAFAIGILGVVFSCLWIMMGKGSKAWYERYEKAIYAFERQSKYATPAANHIGGFKYQNIRGYEKPTIKKCLFSGDGGAYSPSRINIAIGQITLLIWTTIILLHAAIAIFDKQILKLEYIKWIVLVGGVLFIVVFIIMVLYSKFHWLHSGTLNDE